MRLKSILDHFINTVISLVMAMGLYCYGNMTIASTAPRPDLWMPNGDVYSTLADQSTLYIGGDFTYVGPGTGGGIGIDATDAGVEDGLLKVNGIVYTVISDGTDGWYIGGAFDKVGDVTRNNIAHIEKSGTNYIVDADWDPNVNGEVYSLALSAAILYVGGAFTAVDTLGPGYLAALNINATAAPYYTGWDPDADGAVRSMTLSGKMPNTLYIGGDFTSFNAGGDLRNYIAEIDLTAAVTAWDPDADGIVRTMALSGTTLYVGGDFIDIDNDTRNHIAALDTTASSPDIATAWNPGSAGITTINKLTLSGNATLYAGGDFTSATTIGGQNRNYIAELSESTGLATSWNPNANGVVLSMVLSGKSPNTLFVGGDFSSINNKSRLRLAEIDVLTGNAEIWALSMEDKVHTLAMSDDGTKVFAGGEFVSAGGQARNHLAALDIANVVDVLATVNGSVNTVISDGASGWYIGGLFTSVGGIARNNIARIGSDNILDGNWNPNANGAVNAMVLSPNGNVLYVGGDFTNIDGKGRNRIAALTTAVTANIDRGWNPDADATVRAIALSSDGITLYAGGDFTTVDGVTRNHIAALNTSVDTNIDTGWDPNVGGGAVSVYAMVLSADDTTLYAGGNFTTIEGSPRNRVTALDTTVTANIDTGWNPDIRDGTVKTMVLSASGSDLYVGGDFTDIEGAVRNRLAKLMTTATSNIDSGWDPDPGNTVNAIALSADNTLLYTGGDFSVIGGGNREYFAAIDTSTGNATSLTIPVANPVDALALSAADTFIYLGGNAVSLVGRLNVGGEPVELQAGTLTAFDPDVNAVVRAMAITSNSATLYIGGEFTMVNTNQPRNYIAAIDALSGIVTNWDPDADAIVHDIRLSQDGATLYMAGDFTSFNSGVDVRQYIAAISTASGAVTPWEPDADAVVRSITLSDDGATIYVGGDFTVIGQQARSNLAALSASSGAAIPAWVPVTASNIYVTRLSSDESALFAGGVNELTAFNVSDGAVVPSFNPGATVGTVETIEISSDDHMLYLGGSFSSIAGQARNNIARYDLVEDTLTAWDPGANQSVHDLTLTNGDANLVTAGDFTAIGSDNVRIGLASIPMLPPDTSVSPAAGAYTTTQNVTLACTDNSGLGCLETYYTIDGSTPTVASTQYSLNNPINIPNDSTVTIKYFSVDKEGTYETAKSAVYIVDTTAPLTTASPGTGTYNLADGPISLICSDSGGSGCGTTYYTTDGTTPTINSTAYTGPIPLAGLEGIDTLQFFSVDNAGNMELPVNSINYVVDVTLPVTALSHTSGTYPPPQSIVITCDDGNGTGCDEIYYTTDLSAPTTSSTKYTGPITISDGTVIRAMAADAAGNTGNSVVGIYAFTIGAGESRSGVGGATTPMLLVIMLLGVVLRNRHFARICLKHVSAGAIRR